jgi:hypothetical protein
MHSIARIILFIGVCLLAVSAADRQSTFKPGGTDVHQN